jgi:phage gpG-like protein
MRQFVAAALRRAVSLSGTLEGYEQPELVEEIFRKTKAYQPDGDWLGIPNVTTVLDFGGGCGIHYKRARSHAKWAIVETPAMVERAGELATERLRFFTEISEAKKWLGDIDLMHSDGALQYALDPERTMGELCHTGARLMHWNRTALSQDVTERETQLSLLGENGPGAVRRFGGKAVKCVRTKIPERVFLEAHQGYTLTERGPDWFRFSA